MITTNTAVSQWDRWVASAYGVGASWTLCLSGDGAGVRCHRGQSAE